MKMYLISLLLLLVLATSCKKEDNETPGPRSEVPEKMVGQWLYGTFSMTEFWRYDGSYAGNAFEMSVAFDFKKDGRAEMYFMAQATSYGCRTEAFTFKKGTVTFNEDNSFTLYPAEGNMRGFYNCASGKNFNRKAEKSELEPQTYYYSFEKDNYGKEHLVIRFRKEDAQGSYFKRTQW